MPNHQFIRKEIHELKWYWLATLGLLVAICLIPFTGVIASSEGFLYSTAAFGCYVLAHTISTYPFTSEFSNSTMPRLLAQPVSRAQIWNRKILLIFCSLTTVAILEFVALHVLRARIRQELHSNFYMNTIPFILFGAVSPFFSGPLMAIYIRQGLTALLAAMIVPFALIMAGFFIAYLWDNVFAFNPAEEGPQFLHFTLMWWILGITLCAAAHLLARRAFLRLEV